MEMKASGTYLSRGLSYKDAEFELASAPLTHAQRASFDAAAHFWSSRLLPDLEAAAERTGTAPGQLMRQCAPASRIPPRQYRSVIPSPPPRAHRAPSRPTAHHR